MSRGRGRETPIPARRSKGAVIAALSAALALQSPALAWPADGAGKARGPGLDRATVRVATPQPAGPLRAVRSAGRELLSRGYLVPHPRAYDRAKAALRTPVASIRRGQAPRTHLPADSLAFNGISDPRTTPPDPTGAVGLTRYVQLVNTRFAIYRRNGRRLSSGDLGVMTGFGRNFPFLTDPQVIWDAVTRRFYYVVLDFDIAVRPASDGVDFAFGFSKTASPSSARDWCKYALSLGYDRPARRSFRVVDQPHLGDTKGFVLWGGNVFDVATFQPRYRGSDVDWIAKPKRGKGCPKASSLRAGERRKLRTASGSLAFTPVVANQVDPSPTGWVVATPNLPSATSRARILSLFRVTRSRSGGAVIQARGRSVLVPRFGLPPPAPQAGSRRRLDTLDARLLQAVSAVDPARHRVAVWTQHTVSGGAGSIVRWYEIDPFHRSVLQEGRVADPLLYAFNGAISPDRVVRSGVRRFGGSMVLGFNTSSGTTDSAVRMVSKLGGGAQSPFTLVKQSRGPNADGSCDQTGTCRWGDFSGASPDPGAPTGRTHGAVWLTNMWNVPNRPGVDWRTVVWRARP